MVFFFFVRLHWIEPSVTESSTSFLVFSSEIISFLRLDFSSAFNLVDIMNGKKIVYHFRELSIDSQL